MILALLGYRPGWPLWELSYVLSKWYGLPWKFVLKLLFVIIIIINKTGLYPDKATSTATTSVD